MPFRSIHPLNHPEPASLLLDQCHAELWQGPWKNMIYLCDWISCSCEISCLSTNFPGSQIHFKKEHSSCIPGLDITYFSLRSFPEEPVICMLILATQSFLLSWVIVLRTKFISHCLIVFSPFQVLNLWRVWEEGWKGLFNYLFPPEKKYLFHSL